MKKIIAISFLGFFLASGWAAAASVSATYYIKAPWFVRANWFRIEHRHNGDSDLFLAGVGYRF